MKKNDLLNRRGKQTFPSSIFKSKIEGIQMDSSNQNEQLKIKRLINLIYEFSSKFIEDFHSFDLKYLKYLDAKTNFADEIDDFTPQPIHDLFSHLYKAKEEILSVNDFCKDYLFKRLSLSLDEIDIIKDSINRRIEQGISVNRILTDKIDLQPLYDLKEKFS